MKYINKWHVLNVKRKLRKDTIRLIKIGGRKIKMKSELHQFIQDKAIEYLYNKSYWITKLEAQVSIGICDVWGLSRSKNFETMAIEVKVSKADFKSSSQKYKEGSLDLHPAGNRNYILCPKNLIQPDEVHEKYGLLWWDGNRIKNKKQAMYIEQSDRQKLEILIHHLSNRVNKVRP